MASCSAQPPNGNGDDNDEYGWKKTLPPGLDFYPTDVELITEYLKRRAQNLKIYAGIINDLDVYNYRPEELEAYALNHCNGRMYFFTPLKKKSNGGWRGDRVVGGDKVKGNWKASQARETVKDCKGVVIGTKQPLVYHNDKGIKTSWLMSEFRYPAHSKPLPLYNETKHELALCVIYYNKMRAIQNPNHPPYPTQNPNFNATSALQSPNHPPSPAKNSNFIATSSLQNPIHPVQNPNFTTTSTLQNSNHPPYPGQNLNFNATSALQSPNHLPLPVQNSNFVATSSLQNLNHSLSLAQNPKFIAITDQQNFNHSQSSIQNPNFIATSTLQNPKFLPCSLAQNSFQQDDCDLPPLPTAYNNTSSYTATPDGSLKSFDCEMSKWNENETLQWLDGEMCSYLNNKDIFQLHVLSYDSNDSEFKDGSS